MKHSASIHTIPEGHHTMALQMHQLHSYVFRPDLIGESDIHSAVATNNLPKILGGPHGLGAPDKSQIANPIAVVARTPEGVEAQSVITDAHHAPTTMAALQDVTPPGGTIEQEPLDQVLSDRLNATAAPQEDQVLPDSLKSGTIAQRLAMAILAGQQQNG